MSTETPSIAREFRVCVGSDCRKTASAISVTGALNSVELGESAANIRG